MHSFSACEETFNQWAKKGRAKTMAEGHWPSIRQGFAKLPAQAGTYLEVGCGCGHSLQYMATHQFAAGHCTGIDICEEMISRAKTTTQSQSNVHIEQANFLDWQPCDSQQFSTIFSMEVFYYFPSIQAGIEKAASLLKPGGYLMMMVDFYNENPASHTWPQDLGVPMSLWSERDYLKGLHTAGFDSISQMRCLQANSKEDWKQQTGTLCTWGRKMTAT